jgi:hypothetical protein
MNLGFQDNYFHLQKPIYKKSLIPLKIPLTVGDAGQHFEAEKEGVEEEVVGGDQLDGQIYTTSHKDEHFGD